MRTSLIARLLVVLAAILAATTVATGPASAQTVSQVSGAYEITDGSLTQADFECVGFQSDLYCDVFSGTVYVTIFCSDGRSVQGVFPPGTWRLSCRPATITHISIAHISS